MLSRFFRLRLNDAVIVAVIAAAVIAATERHDARVLASDIGITTYTNGTAAVQVLYRRDGGPGTVTILVDGQTVVRDMPAYAEKYSNDNFIFHPAEKLGDQALIRVTFDSDAVVQTVRRTVHVAHAIVPVVSDDDAPAVAARAAVVMAKAHAADGNLPADSQTMTQELKDDMQWTTGMTPEQYVSGLNRWAMKKELPMRTERISGAADVVLDALAHARAAGDTAQLFIRFVRTGKDVGGRTVGVDHVVRTNGGVFIAIIDGAGPAGNDVYEVRQGVIVGYGFSGDTAVIGWGFVQRWTK
jgi:hypothetical protein